MKWQKACEGKLLCRVSKGDGAFRDALPHPLDPEDLVRRANAALDGPSSGRRLSLGQKLRFSVVLAAVLAAAIHFNVLDALLPGRCLLR